MPDELVAVFVRVNRPGGAVLLAAERDLFTGKEFAFWRKPDESHLSCRVEDALLSTVAQDTERADASFILVFHVLLFQELAQLERNVPDQAIWCAQGPPAVAVSD